MSTDIGYPRRQLGAGKMIVVNEQGVALFTQQAASLVREMLCAGANDVELAFFAGYCQRLGLDPFSGHVHLIKRRVNRDGKWVEVARPELSVAGLLLLAERSRKYAGRSDYQWCGKDGVWRDVWLEMEPPSAARVGVYRKGSPAPITGVATWASYAGTKQDGSLTKMWKQHGPRMLGKCALSLALREALPAELGGVYTVEEMQQAAPVDDSQDAPHAVPADRPVVEQGEVLADDAAVAEAAGRMQQLSPASRDALAVWMREQSIPGRGMTADQLALVTDAIATAESEQEMAS